MSATLHWFPADVTPARLAAVLAGMANTNGGTVLIGIAPRSGQIQGIFNLDETLDRIFQAVLLTDPPLVLPAPRPQTVDGAVVLSIQAPAGMPHVYNLEGRFLGRDGVQTNPLPARRLRQLLLERGMVQFEALARPMATWDDLDAAKVVQYVRRLGWLGAGLSVETPGSFGNTAEAEANPHQVATQQRDETLQAVLLRRGCLRQRKSGGQTDYEPTYAALLLFGKYPQQWLPNASILAARFAGTTLTDQFIKQELHGTLPEQIMAAEAFVRDHMRSVVRLIGLSRREMTEYPLEALREVIVNAVAHRDYNVQGDNIHIYMFSDRIEIHSPGGLPGPVNLDNLLEARFSRNAVIAQVLSDLGYVERLGYGLNRALEVLRENQMRPALFEELGGSFRVTMYSAYNKGERLRDEGEGGKTLHPGQSQEGDGKMRAEGETLEELGLNPRQELAIDFLSERRRITSHDYQELAPGVSAETLRRDLTDLVSRGLLIKVGDKRATYYIRKEHGVVKSSK